MLWLGESLDLIREVCVVHLDRANKTLLFCNYYILYVLVTIVGGMPNTLRFLFFYWDSKLVADEITCHKYNIVSQYLLKNLVYQAKYFRV